jgi:CBS domain-containing protein
MKVRDIMTENPACVTPDDSAQQAAQLMFDNDCGCIPVVEAADSGRVVGVVTDRDIAIRGVARKKGPNTKTRELMSSDVCCCSPDDDIKVAERIMADRQVRRVVVVDGAGCCCGVLAQADLAFAAERRRDVSDRELARVVERISQPTQTMRGGTA